VKIENQLTKRHKGLAGTLGEDTVLFVETAMNGELPPVCALDDVRLGTAVRRAVDAGFKIRIEAPNENQ